MIGNTLEGDLDTRWDYRNEALEADLDPDKGAAENLFFLHEQALFLLQKTNVTKSGRAR